MYDQSSELMIASVFKSPAERTGKVIELFELIATFACFLRRYLDFEFYQLRSKSGQSSEMLGGCRNHPIQLVL
jgi:hypothetical protein